MVTVLNATKTIGLTNYLNASRNLTLTKISSAPQIHIRQHSTSRTESVNPEECHVHRQTKVERVDNVFQILSIYTMEFAYL